MRADRLLSILLLLQQGRQYTAHELAERLEVSERTILRDMEALGMSGVPIVSVRGAGGGWSLPENYRTNLTGLSAVEVRTLLFTQSSRLMNDLGLGKAASSAAIKLSASLSARSRHDVEFMHSRLHIDGAGWYQSSEQFPHLLIIQDAVWQERALRMRYMSSDGSLSERVVNPLGIVAKGSVWYLIGTHEAGIRSYRVSRVQDAEIMDVPSVRPVGFDLAVYWRQNVADFKASVPRYMVTLRVNDLAFGRIQASKFLRLESTGDRSDDGWTEIVVRFEELSEAHDYILRVAADAIVLEPSELRERLYATATAIVETYRST